MTGNRGADTLGQCLGIIGESGAGKSIDVESSGSWPASTLSSKAASSADRAIGPIWSRLACSAARRRDRALA